MVTEKQFKLLRFMLIHKEKSGDVRSTVKPAAE